MDFETDNDLPIAGGALDGINAGICHGVSIAARRDFGKRVHWSDGLQPALWSLFLGSPVPVSSASKPCALPICGHALAAGFSNQTHS